MAEGGPGSGNIEAGNVGPDVKQDETMTDLNIGPDVTDHEANSDIGVDMGATSDGTGIQSEFILSDSNYETETECGTETETESSELTLDSLSVESRLKIRSSSLDSLPHVSQVPKRPPISREELQKMLIEALLYRLPDEDLDVIVKSGADVNSPLTRGLRPIHYAAFDNHVDGLKFLFNQSCRINVHDNVGYTAVHICAKHGNYDSLKLLLENGAYATFMGDFAPNDERLAWCDVTAEPMKLALENGHVECAKLLLQFGARVDNRYAQGSEINLVPLENLECLKLLLENKADPNVLSRVGDSPLMIACKEQNLQAAKLLLNFGADVNKKSMPRYEEKTPLYFCILSGNCEMLALLLDNNVSLKTPISRNNNALTFAVSRDKYMMCELLIAHGANVNERNSDGLTPLLAACTTTDLQYQVDLVEILLRNGSDPNTHHYIMRYYTPSLAPIHEYFVFNRAERMNTEIPKLLVKYGSRVSFCLSHSQSVIKDAFSVLNHVRKLEEYDDILGLLFEASEKFESNIIRQCDLIPKTKLRRLLELGSSPLPLKHSCRLMLRRHLGTVLPDKVSHLPLPKILRAYLLYYL